MLLGYHHLAGMMGSSGLILDYNINTNVNIPHEGSNTQSIYYNGTVGYNFGSWRIRSDYQGNYNRTSGDAENNKDLLNFYSSLWISRDPQFKSLT